MFQVNFSGYIWYRYMWMDMLQVHVCGYMLQVHVHGYAIGKMYVNMLSYRYVQLDVYHFIGMLYCMDWSSCFIDSVSFFLSFSLFLSFLLLQEYPSISCQKPWWVFVGFYVINGWKLDCYWFMKSGVFFFIPMGIIQIFVLSRARPASWPSCVARLWRWTFRTYLQPDLFQTCPAYRCCWLLPLYTTFLALTLGWGSQGQRKANPLGLIFSQTC